MKSSNKREELKPKVDSDFRKSFQNFYSSITKTGIVKVQVDLLEALQTVFEYGCKRQQKLWMLTESSQEKRPRCRELQKTYSANVKVGELHSTY